MALNIQKQLICYSGQDRISSLPDSLVHRILSSLKINPIVRTSVLSKRWRYVWSSIPNLDFRYWRSSKSDIHLETERFMNFIDRMLPLLGTSSVHRFSLRCDELCDDSRISALISSVVRCNVVKMNLIFKHERPFLFPSTLFTCDSLKKLWIRSSSVLYLPKSISFPRLKLLQLVLVKFMDDCLTEQLFSNCPVLEDLIIRWCNWVNMKVVCIAAPALKYLIIDCIGDPLNDSILHNCEVKIHAPSLVSLTYRDCIAKEFVFSNLSSLVDAKIDIDVGDNFPETRQEEIDYCAGVTKFLREIVSVKHLEISGNTLEVTVRAKSMFSTTK